MKTPTPQRLLRYVTRGLRLKRYLELAGDGRRFPQIPAKAMLWAILLGQILRESSFHALESLVGSGRGRSLGISRKFGDDALGYFTERLDPAPTRRATIQVVRQAKRNKAFQNCTFVGLALDGTTAGRCREEQCPLCRPFRNSKKQIVGYRHHLVMLSVVGTGLSLPIDVEPYGPDDSEYAAGQRLLQRVIPELGVRFADYLVVDSGFATAPFLHTADDLGLPVVARLKGNLPELYQAAQKRFSQQSAKLSFRSGKDRIEVWDADDFDPWEALEWETVRAIRYRQHKPNGQVVEAEWLTDFPLRQVGSLSLYHMAKSRWEIENQGFNDAKSRYSFEHTCHHEKNSVLLNSLLTLFALTIERLYRIRYLHRGTHTVRSAEQLCRILWVSLSRPLAPNTS